MPIPRRYTTDAIVLSRFDFGEADRILTLITPGFGKLKAIAKGIRRPTSRIGGSLEPFAELTVALARGRTFEVVTQVSVGHAWLNLRDSLESAATAWYLAELADRSLEERHAAEPVYTLLKHAYELLDAGMAPGRVARWFEMHLADELGVRPEVDRCAECDRMLEVDRALPLVAGVGRDRLRTLPGPVAHARRPLARGAEAAEGVPAPGHRGARRAATGRVHGARGRGRDARLHPPRPRARGTVARLPRRGPPRGGAGSRPLPGDPGRAPRHRDGRRPRGGARAAPEARPGALPGFDGEPLRGRGRGRPGVPPDVVRPRRRRRDARRASR